MEQPNYFGSIKRNSHKMTAKTIGTLKIAGVYATAIFTAFFVIKNYPTGNLVIDLLQADISATIVVFVGSGMFKNASVYDPYWSIAPILFLWYWLSMADEITVRAMVASTLVLIWGLRLTYNWYRSWPDLSHEDWRYRQLKKKTKYFYPFVNLLGIHLFPTFLVFIASLPFSYFIGKAEPLGWFDILATAITAIAIYIESRADQELFNFKKINNKSKKPQLLETGLWAYSRHPNYFGETLFWLGMFVFALAAGAPFWPLVLGPIFILILFLGISIPMIDKRMTQRYPKYAERKKNVPKFFPWLKRYI